MTTASFAAPPESIHKQDLIEAFRLYRKASTYITKIQNEVYSSEDDLGEHILSPKFTDTQKQLYSKAKALLSESVKLNPYNPEAFMYLGIYSMQVDKDYQKAQSYFTKALEIDPYYEAILSFRFDMSVELKDFNLAKQDLKTLKEIGSDYCGTCAEQLESITP